MHHHQIFLESRGDFRSLLDCNNRKFQDINIRDICKSGVCNSHLIPNVINSEFYICLVHENTRVRRGTIKYQTLMYTYTALNSKSRRIYGFADLEIRELS